MPIKIISTIDGARFAIKVVPGASRDRIVGALGDALKMAVAKPPQGGAANRAVVKLLASALGVAESDVEIVRGHRAARKEVSVRGMTEADLRLRLEG